MAGFSLFAFLPLAALLPVALAAPWGPWNWGPPKPTWDCPETTPTWTYPTSLPSAWPTVGPTVTATGTATGSGYASPTGFWMNKREAEVMAGEKRAAFEGPRKRDWPHTWPCTDETAWAFPTGTGTGTAYYPTATGATGWMRR